MTTTVSKFSFDSPASYILLHSPMHSVVQKASTEMYNSGSFIDKLCLDKKLLKFTIVTWFRKTDQVVTFGISRNSDFKYSSHCSSNSLVLDVATPDILYIWNSLLASVLQLFLLARFWATFKATVISLMVHYRGWVGSQRWLNLSLGLFGLAMGLIPEVPAIGPNMLEWRNRCLPITGGNFRPMPSI